MLGTSTLGSFKKIGDMVTAITYILEVRSLPENGKLDINMGLEGSCIQMEIFWKVLGKMANEMELFILPFKLERNLKAVLLIMSELVPGQRLRPELRDMILVPFHHSKEITEKFIL